MKRYSPEIVWIDPYTAVPRMSESDTGGFFLFGGDVSNLEDRVKCAEEQRRILAEQVDELKAKLNAAKDAISPVVAYYQWLIDDEDGIEDGELVIGCSFSGITKEQLDDIVTVYEDLK